MSTLLALFVLTLLFGLPMALLLLVVGHAPTGGFVVGFILAAVLLSWSAEHP